MSISFEMKPYVDVIWYESEAQMSIQSKKILTSNPRIVNTKRHHLEENVKDLTLERKGDLTIYIRYMVLLFFLVPIDFEMELYIYLISY